MIDGRINTYLEEETESENEGDKDQERKQFIDAHYLNRRKSCQCNCCGGLDSNSIKKMDKASMD